MLPFQSMWCICRYGWNLNMEVDQKSHKSFQQVQTQTLSQEHFCSQSKAGIGFKSIHACQNFRCITGSCWHKNHYINNYSPPSIRTLQQTGGTSNTSLKTHPAIGESPWLSKMHFNLHAISQWNLDWSKVIEKKKNPSPYQLLRFHFKVIISSTAQKKQPSIL